MDIVTGSKTNGTNRILLRAIEAGIVIEGCIDFPGCDHEPSSVGCGHSGSLRGGGWPAFQREGRQDPGRVCSGLSLPDRLTSLAGRITGHRVLGQAGALHQTSRSPGKKHYKNICSLSHGRLGLAVHGTLTCQIDTPGVLLGLVVASPRDFLLG